MARFLWTQKQDIGPAPRFGHAMCYDSARQLTFIFGGAGDEPFGDSWIWSGETWTQVADTGPAARRDHAMCFDTARGVALLFGGSSNGQVLGDTWSWDGEDWTQVEDTGPAARGGHAMAFDSQRSRAILFGGNDGANTLRDTWEWDGEAWTQVEDAGPLPRRHHALAYDLARQRTVLFGGESEDGATLRDTWEWDGSNWTQIEDIGPPACMRASLVSTDAQLVLFGGISHAAANPPPTLFDDSWAFEGGHWTQRQDMGPAARWSHTMAFDTQRRTIVLFGGSSGAAVDQAANLRRDTWEHLETEPAVGGGGGGGGPNAGSELQQLDLVPTEASPGQVVTAEVTLAGMSQQTTQVMLVWLLQSILDNANNSGNPVSSADINPIGQLDIPPGMLAATLDFAAPAASEPVVVVVAYTALGSQAAAQLSII